MTLNELIKTAAGTPFSITQKPDYWHIGADTKPTPEDWTKAAPARQESKPAASQPPQPAQPPQPTAASGPAPRAVPWIEQPEGQQWQQNQRRQRAAYDEMNGFNDIVTRTPEVAQRMGGMPGATPSELLRRAAETENQILDEREAAERAQNEAAGRAVTAENNRIAQRAQQEATARSVIDENNRIAQRAMDEQAKRDQEATAKAVASENEHISQRAKAEAVDEARANAAGQYAQDQMQERQRVAYEQQQRDNMHQYYMQNPGKAPYAVPAAEQPEGIAQRQEEERQQLAEQNRARQESQDAAMRFREGQAWTADQIAAGDEVDRARAEAAEQGAQAQALERQREAYTQQQQQLADNQAWAEQQAAMAAQTYDQAYGEELARQRNEFYQQQYQQQLADEQAAEAARQRQQWLQEQEQKRRQQQWYQQWLADQARNAQGIMAENDRIAQDVQQQWQQQWHDQGIADIHDVILTNMFTDENGNEKIPTKEEWDAAIPYLKQNYGDALVDEAMEQQIVWMEERRDIGIRMYNTALEWLEADPSHVIGDEEKAIIAQAEGFDDPGAFDRFVGSTNMYIPGRDSVVLRQYGEPVETSQVAQGGTTDPSGEPDIFGDPNGGNPNTDPGQKVLNSPGFLGWAQQNPTTASMIAALLVGGLAVGMGGAGKKDSSLGLLLALLLAGGTFFGANHFLTADQVAKTTGDALEKNDKASQPT